MNSLPPFGLSALQDFWKKTWEISAEILNQVRVQSAEEKENTKRAAQYAVASEFMERFEERYGEDLAPKLERFFSNPEVQQFWNDCMYLELGKIKDRDDSEALQFKHQANGVMIVPSLVERLKKYRQVIEDWEGEKK